MLITELLEYFAYHNIHVLLRFMGNTFSPAKKDIEFSALMST